MKEIGRVMWFLCAGMIQCLFYLTGALVLTVTAAGLSHAKQLIHLCRGVLNPFGKKITTNAAAYPAANILWAILIGWVAALVACITGFLFCMTVIGINIGLECFRLAKVSLLPFGAAIG